MIKTFINLQELRRRIYFKAKAQTSWRFWGLYVHVCKVGTLEEAYYRARKNNGVSGVDEISFEDIESKGVDKFILELHKELTSETYNPMKRKEVKISKGNGKTRTLKIPTIKDRVVEGALKLILEAIFEADFQEGSYGYRPKRSTHQAIKHIEKSIVEGKTKIIDLDLKNYFDSIQHCTIIAKVAKRVNDAKVMRLLKLILKAGGKRGICQGGVISPLLSNLYLNDTDKMIEKAIKVTRKGKYTHIAYARFADDLVILIDYHPRWKWLEVMLYKRLKEELGKIGVEINTEKTKTTDLRENGKFSFVGFEIKRIKSASGKWYPYKTPKKESRTKLVKKLKRIFMYYRSKPTDDLINVVNSILQGWVNYFRIGNSTNCFKYVKQWVEKKLRRHLTKARGLSGYGWNKWSKEWIYIKLGLFNNYQVRYY